MSTADSPAALPSHRQWWIWAALLAIAVAGVVVYAGSLNGPLVFDDISNIVENDAVQRPAVHKLYETGGRRQVAFATFALNQLVHGTWPPGYRATNVAIHILAAIVLFDLVRRTLERTSFAHRHAAAILPAAFCAAMLWVVHPLTTQAVTYVVQRMESLASLFYLATLWALARGVTGSRGWLVLSVVCCWLGMATKETAATLPLAALLFDRIYFVTSWRELVRRRWAYYVALVPPTLWLAASALPAFRPPPEIARQRATVGVGIAEATPWEYLRTQAGIVLHYLRLTFWPVGQCFDYGWPVARQWHDWLPSVIVVSLLLLATAALLWRWPRVGFLPAMFFLVLAPSSSLLPIRDLAVEHRMYLPLAVVITAVAIAGFTIAGRWIQGKHFAWLRLGLPLFLAAIATALLGGVTIARNRVYSSETTLWHDVVAKAPRHARAHYNLGLAHLSAGQTDIAMQRFRQAVESSRAERSPIRALIVAQYGVRLAQQGSNVEGLRWCELGAQLDANSSEIQINLGTARALAGNDSGAIVAFQRAIELRADRVEAHFNLGQIAARMGKLKLAEHHLAVAAQLDPTLPEVHERLARVRLQLHQRARRVAPNS